ncbi:MAG: pyruvate kinase [Candidatus Binatia bacterium]|nr:pyruvate kinase [Candidatus Binatia bacterium]
MKRDFDIIATISSRILNENVLPELIQEGATIARLNGAHCSIETLKPMIADIRRIAGRNIKIMIDLPGRKVRTRDLVDPIVLRQKGKFHLYSHQVNYAPFLQMLQKGQEILANDGLFRFEVAEKLPDRVTFISHSEGVLENNKGLHVINGTANVPALLEQDHAIIDLAKKTDVDLLALSFVHTADDVRGCLECLEGSSVGLVTKVETQLAVENLSEILDVSDPILIDRGDLAAEVGVQNVPLVQDHIIREALMRDRGILLATQFLHTMVKQPTPLIAEVNDIHASIRKNVQGLQLSEETAIGRYPVECVKIMRGIYEKCSRTEPRAISAAQ